MSCQGSLLAVIVRSGQSMLQFIVRSGLMLCVLAWFVARWGMSPRQTVNNVRAAYTSKELYSQRQFVMMFGWCVIWSLIGIGVLWVLWRSAERCVGTLRTLRRTTSVSPLQRYLRSLLVFVFGFAGITRLVPSTTAEVRGDIFVVPDSTAQVPRQSTILPALASAGLAVGVAAHLQRERAALLRDAPTTARLRRPDAASLARATAVFERAKSWQQEHHSVESREVPPIREGLLIPLGQAQDHLVQVRLAAGDIVSIEADSNEAMTVLRHVVNTLALAPWLSNTQLILCGISSGEVIAAHNVLVVDNARTAVTRALHHKELNPQCSVVVVTSAYSAEFSSLQDAGIALITAGCAQGDTPTTRVIREPRVWRVSPQDTVFFPYGVTAHETADLQSMVRASTVLEESAVVSSASVDSVEVMLRLLGPVELGTRDGREIVFRKSKSMELLCWAALHRDRPTVSAARTALWEIDVEDATFHNVFSELRRGLVTAGIRDGIRRVTRQQLFLAPEITTDAETLRAVLLAAEQVEDVSQDALALEALTNILALVRGLPFASQQYAWADAEGITSTFVWLVTRAVETAVQLARDCGNDAALMAAVSAGLRMLPGDEHFISLRDEVAVGPRA